MSAGHDDYAVEPIRGLPENLPPNEAILWQGAPDVWEMAKHVFHIRLVAAYLLCLTAWRFSVHLQAGNAGAAIVASLSLLSISLLALGLLPPGWASQQAGQRVACAPFGMRHPIRIPG